MQNNKNHKEEDNLRNNNKLSNTEEKIRIKISKKKVVKSKILINKIKIKN